MKYSLLYIAFLFVSFGSFAKQNFEGIAIDSTQIEKKQFDKESLQQYENDNDFNYNVKKKEDNILQRLWSWLGRVVKKMLSWMFEDISPAVGLIKDFLSILPYILLGILLYFIAKFFLKVNTKNLLSGNTKVPGIYMTDDEELIKSNNLQNLIEQSITAKNYRLAIRYYYLLILKKLAEKELISWQQEKTNEDYIKELSATKISEEFSKSTRVYDFVWYGDFQVNELQFKKAQSLFTNLKNKIGG